MTEYSRKSDLGYRIRRKSLKKTHTGVRVLGCLERAGVGPGDFFCKQLLREKCGMNARSIKPEDLRGIVAVPVKGNPRARNFLRLNTKVAVVNIDESE